MEAADVDHSEGIDFDEFKKMAAKIHTAGGVAAGSSSSSNKHAYK